MSNSRHALNKTPSSNSIVEVRKALDNFTFLEKVEIKENVYLSTPANTNFEENFDSVLYEPIMCSEFRKYLSSSHCSENLDFWKAVENFKTSQNLREQAKIIFDKYFNRKSGSEITIPRHDQESLAAIISDPESDIQSDIFDRIQQEVYHLMKGHFKGFLTSEQFLEGSQIVNKVKLTPINSNSTVTSLTARDWKVLFTGSTEIEYSENTTIIEQGQSSPFVYQLIEGSLLVEKSYKDTIQRIDTITQSGEVVGDLTIIKNTVSSSSCIAVAGTKLNRVRTHFVSQLLENDPELARKFYINVGCKLATLLDNLSRISKEKETTPKKKGLPVLAIESNEKQVLDKEFLSRFALTNQLLLKQFPCSWEKVVIRKGTFYISQNYACFYAKVFTHSTKEILPIVGLNISTKPVSKGREIVLKNEKKKLKLLFSNEDGEIVYNLLQDMVNIQKDTVQEINVPSTQLEEEDILSGEEWEIILDGDASWNPLIKFSPGDIILREGQQYSMICQIATGTCRIEKLVPDSDNISIVLGRISNGEIFGEIQFLTERTASASVIAEDFVDMYVIDGHFVRDILFKSQPQVTVHFYHYLCSVLSQRVEQREKEGWGRKKK